MKKLNSLFGIAVVCLSLASCSSKLMNPSQSQLDGLNNPEISMSDLEAGKEIYKNQCNLCHGYYDPASYTADSWKKIVPAMSQKVNEKVGSEVIDGVKEYQLLNYILAVKN